MNFRPILQRHPALRWLAPAGIACLAGFAATGAFTPSASSSDALPRTTPSALIAAVRNSDVTGFSGTVVSHLSLGLPELPDLAAQAGDASTFAALLTGSHTLQVWYGGYNEQRIALQGSTDETDLFRDGDDLWQYSSADHVAVHIELPVRESQQESRSATPLPSVPADLTPTQLADRLLTAIDPSTRVQVEHGGTVADRATYTLQLTPRTADTKIGSVRISLDGETKLPLAVQVYARGAQSPAIDVAFTSIVFAHQPERNFSFSPPPGAKVERATIGRRQAERDSSPAPSTGTPQHRRPARIAGSGWSSVAELRPSSRALAELRGTPLLRALTPVSGSWGKGRLLDTQLVSALLTDDGRVYVGAVPASDLYAAAARR